MAQHHAQGRTTAVKLDGRLQGDHAGDVALLLRLRILLQRDVVVGHICVVVLAVVQLSRARQQQVGGRVRASVCACCTPPPTTRLHNLAANHRLQRPEVVGQVRQLGRGQAADAPRVRGHPRRRVAQHSGGGRQSAALTRWQCVPRSAGAMSAAAAPSVVCACATQLPVSCRRGDRHSAGPPPSDDSPAGVPQPPAGSISHSSHTLTSVVTGVVVAFAGGAPPAAHVCQPRASTCPLSHGCTSLAWLLTCLGCHTHRRHARRWTWTTDTALHWSTSLQCPSGASPPRLTPPTQVGSHTTASLRDTHAGWSPSVAACPQPGSLCSGRRRAGMPGCTSPSASSWPACTPSSGRLAARPKHRMAAQHGRMR